MKEILGKTLSQFTLGPVGTFENAQTVPVIDSPISHITYISFSAALRAGTLRVTEVSESGSVPQLTVLNHADEPVLLVDGEELVGAKQNRILNASILVPAHSKITVPVSCTESGRWRYSTPQFNDSGVVAAREVRLRKNLSVQESLRSRAAYDSDQAEIWASIDDLHLRSGSASPTAAMKDAFEAGRARIDAAVRAFPLVENQRGMFFLAGGRVLGLDVVSRPEVYADLHEKLVRSYAIDLPTYQGDATDDPEKLVYGFMDGISRADVTQHEAVAVGTDLRFSSEGAFGAALTVEDEVVHLNAFPSERDEHRRAGSRMAGYRARRSGFRGL